MEADFTEVEVTSIPKSQHRLITGVKGAMVKALRKEFGCEIEIPEEKSRHSTIIVGGPAAKVKLCIAKIEALASADRNASSVSPPAVVVEGKGQKVSAQTAALTISCAAAGICNDTNPKLSTRANVQSSTTIEALAAITYAFNFEKAAHAKLKGPRDSKKAEYEALLLARLSAPQNNSTNSPPPPSSSSLSSGKLGFTVSAVRIDFPPSDDLTNTTIAVRAYGPAARVHNLNSLQKSDCEEQIRSAVTALLEERRLFHHIREGTAIREVPFAPLPPPTNTTTPPTAISSNTACPSPHNEKTKAQELGSAKKASGNTDKNLAAANNNNKNRNNDTTTNSGGGDDQREDGESKDLNDKGMGRRNTNNNNNTTKAGGGAGQRRKGHEESTPAPKTTPTAVPATAGSASSAATEGGEAKVAANAANEGSSLSELSSQAHTQRRDDSDGNDDGATQKPHAAAVGGKNRERRGRGGQGKKGTEAEAEDATAEANKTAEASTSQKIVDTTVPKRGVGDVGDAVWKNLYRFPLHPYDAKNTQTATSTAIPPTDILAMMGAPPQRAMFA